MVLVAACTVGPDYKRPLVQVPDAYRDSPAAVLPSSGAASIADQKWWEVFDDPVLQEQLAAAVRQNFDVRIAAARVLQARAQLGVVKADEQPTVDAGAGAARERLPQSAGLPALQTYALNVQLSAAWELDFWGKFRRATEGARAAARQRVGQRAVVTSLVSQVAGAHSCARSTSISTSRGEH